MRETGRQRVRESERELGREDNDRDREWIKRDRG